jgi:hypothetical protein
MTLQTSLNETLDFRRDVIPPLKPKPGISALR